SSLISALRSYRSRIVGLSLPSQLACSIRVRYSGSSILSILNADRTSRAFGRSVSSGTGPRSITSIISSRPPNDGLREASSINRKSELSKSDLAIYLSLNTHFRAFKMGRRIVAVHLDHSRCSGLGITSTGDQRFTEDFFVAPTKYRISIFSHLQFKSA